MSDLKKELTQAQIFELVHNLTGTVMNWEWGLKSIKYKWDDDDYDDHEDQVIEIMCDHSIVQCESCECWVENDEIIEKELDVATCEACDERGEE